VLYNEVLILYRASKNNNNNDDDDNRHISVPSAALTGHVLTLHISTS